MFGIVNNWRPSFLPSWFVGGFSKLSSNFFSSDLIASCKHLSQRTVLLTNSYQCAIFGTYIDIFDICLIEVTSEKKTSTMNDETQWNTGNHNKGLLLRKTLLENHGGGGGGRATSHTFS